MGGTLVARQNTISGSLNGVVRVDKDFKSA